MIGSSALPPAGKYDIFIPKVSPHGKYDMEYTGPGEGRRVW